MHVVLSGYYGFDNCGDEAILYSVIQALRNTEPEIRITVLSNNPGLTERLYHVEAVNRMNFRSIYKVIKHADGLISGGGSLLQDKTGIKSIPYYSGIIQMALWHHKPVFVYAQGMGPISRQLGKWLVKNTLNKVEKITVRDIDSQNLLKEIGVRKDSIIVPDPVLGLDKDKFISPDKSEKPYVAVSVRDWPTDAPYKQKIALALDQIASKGYEIVFVPMHGKQDEKTSRETGQIMKEKSIISSGDCSIEEKVSLIGGANLLIGMRLHSLIFSAVNYTPFIAISYDPKIDSFSSICNQPVVGHVEKDDWDSEALFNQAVHALENEEIWREKLQSKVPIFQNEALQTPVDALETLKRGT